MNLPEGISNHPREQRLIASDAPAIIRISTGSRYPQNTDYSINDRPFTGAIAPYLHGDWDDFDRLFRLEQRCVVYSGAEHAGRPKLPNITVLPNLLTTVNQRSLSPYVVLGCTMGHYHPEKPLGYRVQEVYEFQSSGMLVLDREDGQPELWVAREGDKVSVPNGCHMTLYNLGDEDQPLVTLDFANPACNDADKVLIEDNGPILLGYYDDCKVVFTLNRLYINSTVHRAGVRLPSPPKDLWEREVRIDRGARVELGRLLYEQLTQNPDVIGRFAQLGVTIRRATPEAILEPLSQGRRGPRLHFALPLVEATQEGTEAYRYFLPDSQQSLSIPSQVQSIARELSQIVTEKQRLIELKPTSRLAVVVEGGGDWVEQCYRDLFGKVSADGYTLAVYYADDTRWKGRPGWATCTSLKPWETYLDKADPHDYAIYKQLTPDVVFVATPDYTHSEIASRWLDNGPLVFVEKPFDSQLGHVETLLRNLGRQRRTTAVLGLDHWQFYALPVHTLMVDICTHLDGALAKVAFYMTEDRPIELGRERTLQHGLTLDLLPHLLALLTYFGDVGTVDEIEVIEAGRYRNGQGQLICADRDRKAKKDISDVFQNETYSQVSFSFQDYSGCGFHIPCVGIVGKGFASGPKYLEITGVNGNAVRVDFNRPPEPNLNPDYPWDNVFFLQADRAAGSPPVQRIHDPYNRQRELRILNTPQPEQLERDRYRKLLEDLLNGTSHAVASTLLLTEAEDIVSALDRIWWAVQAAREQWIDYELDTADPVCMQVPK